MNTFIKLMDNKLVAFLFGVIFALIGYFGGGNVAFAFAFTVICIAFKELVNNQMCDNPFKYQIPLAGIIGSIVALVWFLF